MEQSNLTLQKGKLAWNHTANQWKIWEDWHPEGQAVQEEAADLKMYENLLFQGKCPGKPYVRDAENVPWRSK